MKKIVLILLLILVTAGIGLLLYMLLTRTTPVYAGSSNEIIFEGSEFAVSASYYAGLDKAEVETALLDVQEGVEGALTAYDAILAKGTPVFHPTFDISLKDYATGYFAVQGAAEDIPLDGQQQVGFYCADLTLNVYTDGNSKIISFRNIMPTELVRQNVTLPVIYDDALSASAVLSDATDFDMYLAFLDGKTTTTLTFEWTYNVRCSVPLNLSGLDEQTVSVDITFTNDSGIVTGEIAEQMQSYEQ